MKSTVLQQMILVNFWKATAFVQVLILMMITWAYFPNWIQKKIAFSLQEEVHFQDAKTTAIGVKSRFYKRRGTLFISLGKASKKSDYYHFWGGGVSEGH